MWGTRLTRPDLWPVRWPEIVWAAFAAANVGVMLAVPNWQTIPFHLIWVSLTVLYGFRLWTTRPTTGVLAVVAVVTGAAVLAVGEWNSQRLNELAEVPLMAAMFMVMVAHARRRYTAERRVRRAVERERDFVRDASHQLRTPITVARGHTELIRDAAASSNEVARDAGIVLEELKRLSRTCDRMLALASAEHPGFLMLAPVDLDELISEAAARWTEITEREWEVSAEARGTLVADRERLDAALDAMIENAVKATAPGGRIGLETRASGSLAIVAVADSGHGIDPKDHERIFDRFARLPDGNGRMNGGTGLGLPMVKAITEAHGGTIAVISRPGRGTRLELRFDGLVPFPDAAETAMGLAEPVA